MYPWPVAVPLASCCTPDWLLYPWRTDEPLAGARHIGQQGGGCCIGEQADGVPVMATLNSVVVRAEQAGDVARGGAVGAALDSMVVALPVGMHWTL